LKGLDLDQRPLGYEPDGRPSKARNATYKTPSYAAQVNRTRLSIP